MRTESLKRGVMALAIVSAMMLGGCGSMAATENPIGGSAAGSASADANKTLEHCAKPLGTLAVEEDTSQNWFAILTTQYHLPATTPLIRLMIQQSNCFVVVDRGRAMSSMMQERGLADSGELRGRSNMGKGQMVAADYVVTPTIQFAEDTGGGSGALAAVGGNYGALLGAIAGSIKHREASTTLMLTDVRSGVQVAVAQGSASKNDFGFGALGLGSSAGAGVGGYSRTPQGRLIAAAFLDSYNEMVRAVRNYAPQRVAGGLGTGGHLAVDGASGPQAESISLADAQRRLASLGLYTSKVDGLPGPGTTRAISRFQQIRGLTVTGKLDDATVDALKN
jgi:curli biogenesis system outer membrane secretion channel CsgG